MVHTKKGLVCLAHLPNSLFLQRGFFCPLTRGVAPEPIRRQCAERGAHIQSGTRIAETSASKKSTINHTETQASAERASLFLSSSRCLRRQSQTSRWQGGSRLTQLSSPLFPSPTSLTNPLTLVAVAAETPSPNLRRRPRTASRVSWLRFLYRLPPGRDMGAETSAPVLCRPYQADTASHSRDPSVPRVADFTRLLRASRRRPLQTQWPSTAVSK